MGRVRSFRDDPILEQKLNALNRNEMGRLIRALLYNYFFGEQKPMIYYPQISIPREDIEMDNTPAKDFKLDMFD